MSLQYFIYRFTTAQRDYGYCGVTHEIRWEGARFAPVNIAHSAPTFSSDPSQCRTIVKLKDDLQVALDYISHPPPYKTELRIWEVLDVEEDGNVLNALTVEPYWKGQIVRVAWKRNFTVAEITCKTLQEVHFSRETLNEGLNPLCRFHNGDGRCPVNIEDFKETVTVTDISEDVSEPTVTVSGILSANTYKGGTMRTADFDWRTIVAQGTGPNIGVLTLSRAFPRTGLQIGDSVDIFFGDDLTEETCRIVFGAATENGKAWGGWKWTPNQDFGRFGIREQQ